MIVKRKQYKGHKFSEVLAKNSEDRKRKSHGRVATEHKSHHGVEAIRSQI